MKVRNFISVLTVLAMIIATPMFGQQKGDVRILLKGNAYVVGNENGYGLEVGGKLVVAKNYNNFQTDGAATHFAVEAKDGKYGVCDSKGTFIYKCTYYEARITGDMIRLKTTKDSEPKFYKTTSPTTEMTVTKVDPNTFRPEIRAMHEHAENQAKEIAAQDAFAAFTFKTNSRGWQELYVDGKKLFEARTFNLISTYDFYKKSTCFFFIVTERVKDYGKDAYGLFGLSIYQKDGKKVVDSELTIPYEYSYIGLGKGATVECTTFSGARKWFDWMGDPILP